jgi:hypothetical protein
MDIQHRGVDECKGTGLWIPAWEGALLPAGGILGVRTERPDMNASDIPARNVQPEASPSERLDSWKEIASYLDRSVRTVKRWERLEGLPVRRHQHERSSSVYAYTSELDAWAVGREPQRPREASAQADAQAPAVATNRLGGWRPALAMLGFAAITLTTGAYLVWQSAFARRQRRRP